MTLGQLIKTLDDDTKFVKDWSDSDSDYKESDLLTKRTMGGQLTLDFWKGQGYLDTNIRVLGAYALTSEESEEQIPYLFIGLSYSSFEKVQAKMKGGN